MTEYSTSHDVPPTTTTAGTEEDMNRLETGSVGSFALGGGGGVYNEDDDSIYTQRDSREHGTDGPHSGKYTGLNHAAKYRNKHYHDNGGNGHFVSNDHGHVRTYQYVRGRSVPIEYYMTKYTPGTLIRNAISGIREHNLYVGKKEEYSFFKVKLALSDMGQDQYGTLFYNSPEEYERHFYTTVPQRLKEEWMERIMSVHRATAATTTHPYSNHATTTNESPSTTFNGWFQNHQYKSAPITV